LLGCLEFPVNIARKWKLFKNNTLDKCTSYGTFNQMSTNPILTVNFFLTESGNEPVREWLKDMEKEDKKQIGEDIMLVQFRWPLGMPLVRKMETDIWEVRSKLSNGNISRVFFTIKNGVMTLLHGIIKKSQKTPKKDIDLARSRKNMWLSEV